LCENSEKEGKNPNYQKSFLLASFVAQQDWLSGG
jgi:hypothetical protein